MDSTPELPEITAENVLQIQYLNNILEQAKKKFSLQIFKGIEFLIWANLQPILDKFKKEGWNDVDFMQSDWSKEAYGDWRLGENKNEIGECINCKGASIGYGIVHIMEFYDEGSSRPSKPYIMLNECKIIIYP